VAAAPSSSRTCAAATTWKPSVGSWGGGFAVIEEIDIAPNVVRALERDNERKVELMKQRVPKMFLSAFSEFAGTIGSDRHRSFADGRMRYFSWNLQPV
jgi:hypothetical protein